MESLIFCLFLNFVQLSPDISVPSHHLQVAAVGSSKIQCLYCQEAMREPRTQDGPDSPYIPRVASNSFPGNLEYLCLIMLSLTLLLYMLPWQEWGCTQFKWFVMKSRIHFLVSYPWLSLGKMTRILAAIFLFAVRCLSPRSWFILLIPILQSITGEPVCYLSLVFFIRNRVKWKLLSDIFDGIFFSQLGCNFWIEWTQRSSVTE